MNITQIKQVTYPVTFFQDTEDWITPYVDNKRLFEEIKIKKQGINNHLRRHHNHLLQFDEYHIKLK